MKQPVAPILSVALVLVPLSALSGCGRKTPPVPPQTVLPTPISDLRQQLDEHGVTLTWTAPSRTVQGDRLPRIDGFELLRAVVAEDDYCEGCPINFGRPIKISPDETLPGDTVRYREAVLRPGYHYFYKIRTKLGWYYASDDSNIVSFAWNTLLSPATNLAAVAGDRKITLSWQPPTTLIDNTPITGNLRHQIFRSDAGAEFIPLGPPVAANSFTDVSVQNGIRYFYKVQPLSKNAVGMMSASTQARPRDMTPPTPPRDVTAVLTPDGIKVLWQQTTETDLAGYRIYRRRSDEKTATLVGKVRNGVMMYLDTTPITPATWYYSVTAYDYAEPANESDSFNEAELTISQ